MEKEARDKFEEEGNVVRPYNPTQSYSSNPRKLEQWTIVKMTERANNVAKDWTNGRGGRGGAKEKNILEKLDNDD